ARASSATRTARPNKASTSLWLKSLSRAQTPSSDTAMKSPASPRSAQARGQICSNHRAQRLRVTLRSKPRSRADRGVSGAAIGSLYHACRKRAQHINGDVCVRLPSNGAPARRPGPGGQGHAQERPRRALALARSPSFILRRAGRSGDGHASGPGQTGEISQALRRGSTISLGIADRRINLSFIAVILRSWGISFYLND